MSSSLFYSSPPPASHFQHQQQTSFLTPQVHRSSTSSFATSRWSSFQPKSPSPLRASSNTGNLSFGVGMRRQQHDVDTKYGHRSDGEDEHDENVMSMGMSPKKQDQAATGSNDTSFFQAPDAQQQSYLFTPFLDSESATTTQSSPLPSLFTVNTTVPETTTTNTSLHSFSSPISSSTTTNKNPFQFQQRARDSSSTAQLSSRISNGRQTRKNDFLSRLRRSRRDERDTRGIDSFERGEYLRERREWEETMRREARMFDIELEDDELMEGDEMDEEGDMSPVDEEREVQELVEGYLHPDGNEGVSEREHVAQGDEGRNRTHRLGQDEDPFELDAIDGDEDSAYELVFMEVLSQEQSSRQGLEPSLDALSTMGYDLSCSNHESGVFARDHGGDDAAPGDVDMS